MKAIQDLINPRVLNRPAYDQKHVTTCWERNNDLQRLMSNESSYPPLASVQEAICKIAASANWYPEDPDYASELRGLLADYCGVRAEHITLGNGSMELIDLLFQTFLTNPGVDECLLIDPDYTAYKIRANLFGWKVSSVAGGVEFESALTDLTSRVSPETRLVLFSRPNNPTGKLVAREDILQLLDTGCLLILDEAYVELAEAGTSLAGEVLNHPNLIVLRTFSKGFGLAGLRLGYTIANPEIIHYLNRARHIFNVNLVAMVAGVALMKDLDHARAVIEEQRQTRERLFTELSRLPGLEPIPSQANFILIRVADTRRTVADYVTYLFDRGFLVRDFSKKRGLEEDRYFRITVGQPEFMNRLVQALQEMP